MLFCWTRSENAECVSAVLKCLQLAAKTFFGIPEVLVEVVFIDHSEAFYNGVTMDFSGTKVDCYAHMYRKVREGSRCSSKKNLDIILADIALLSTAYHGEAVRTQFKKILAYLGEKRDIHTVPFTRDCIHHQLNYIVHHPIPAQVLEKARMLVTTRVPAQYAQVGDVLCFNRSTHSDEPVTPCRAQEYLRLSDPEASTPSNWEAYKGILTLYAFTTEEKEGGHVTFRCNCKLFHHSGYICSHSLAARHMHRSHTIDLHKMAQHLPATKKVGRKRKNTGALVVEDNTVSTAKVKVVHLNDMTPIAKPMALVGARVLDEANVLGAITGYHKPTGIYTVTMQGNASEWSETEVRRGLEMFKTLCT
jgi:hypothetical protein